MYGNLVAVFAYNNNRLYDCNFGLDNEKMLKLR